MIWVDFKELEIFTKKTFLSVGLSEEHADWVTDVFMRATLRGVGHHDIKDLPRRLNIVRSGRCKAQPEISLLKKHEALENYNGDHALGEICSMFVMKRACHLADQHGIGLATIINSDHFLAAAPYVEIAAEKGYLGILFTRTGPTMGVPGRSDTAIGTCPMGFGAPTNKDYPLMLDICFAYASAGVLKAKAAAGEKVPSYWGMDSEGNPSTDPAAIKYGGTRAPMGGHKGFGLSMLGELLTGVLSGGQVIDEPNPETGEMGTAQQAAIAIKPNGLMPLEVFKSRITGMIDRMEARAPGVHIPGQGSYKNRQKILSEGRIALKPELVKELNDWAEDLFIEKLNFTK